MEQFTASEVRDLAKRGTDAMQQFIDGRHTLHVPPQFDDADMVIAECLRAVDAFADMLEAQEKAEAIGFLSGGALAALVDCRSDDYNGNVDLWMRSNDAVKATIPVYTRPSPSDAERLAEALRNLVSEWVAIADDGDTTLEDSTIGYRACANRLSAMLATHSAQAQPPAARVTDAMQELEDKYHGLLWAVARKFPGETRHETALRYIREAEGQEAALAAQENPNG